MDLIFICRIKATHLEMVSIDRNFSTLNNYREADMFN